MKGTLIPPIIDAINRRDWAEFESWVKFSPDSVNAPNPYTGHTPLMIAGHRGFLEYAKRLLAEPHIDLTARDLDGFDAKDVARMAQHHEIVWEIIWTENPELRPEPGPDGNVAYEPIPPQF